MRPQLAAAAIVVVIVIGAGAARAQMMYWTDREADEAKRAAERRASVARLIEAGLSSVSGAQAGRTPRTGRGIS